MNSQPCFTMYSLLNVEQLYIYISNGLLTETADNHNQEPSLSGLLMYSPTLYAQRTERLP